MLFRIILLLVISASTIAHADSSFVFVQNDGQWQEEVLFRCEPLHYSSLLKNGVSFRAMQHTSDNNISGYIWNLRFQNTEAYTIETKGRKSSRRNYFRQSQGVNVSYSPSQADEVLYKNIYPSTDVRFYNKNNELEFDFILHPGSELSLISCIIEGPEDLSIDQEGNLILNSEFKSQRIAAPVSWQYINSEKVYIKTRYILINDSTFGLIAEESYDRNTDLIIDPLFQMVWCSYTKATGVSNNINYCFGSAMDKNGNVYLTGIVDGTFPVTAGSYSGPGNIFPDVFVAKFSSDGTTMLYSTYLPGNSSEFGADLAVDDSGRAYVTGVVDLNITGITNFPSTSNAFQPVHNANSDAYLTVLTPDGSGLVYSTFIGGSFSESGYGVDIDSAGFVYVTGNTTSTDFPLINTTSIQSGDQNAFVMKFDISQSGSNSVIYSTMIGGGSFSSTYGRSIAVNNSGNAFITGNYQSSFGTPLFPVTPGAMNSTYNTGSDGIMCYALKLSASTPVALDYCTYLGPGSGNGIDVNDAGEAYISGSTRTFTFPVSAGALQFVHGQDALGNPNGDAFVMKLDSTGSNYIYSTFLGGEDEDKGAGIKVNSLGEAYITGIAQGFFPVSAGGYQPSNAGSEDYFLVQINATGTGYGCGGSTYIGGSDEDYTGSFYDYPSPKLSLNDHAGNDTVAITGTSHSQDFPTTPGVYGPVKVNGIADQPVFFKMTCVPNAISPVASLSAFIDTACNESSVDFTDLSSNSPTTWTWYFPGGQPQQSTIQHPQNIIYNTPGNYTVSLVACNAAGCDSVSFPIIISFFNQPSVNLGNDTSLCNSPGLTLNAGSGFSAYLWSLNNNPAGSDPDITVNQSGEYAVVVTSNEGCTATDTVQINFSVVDIQLTGDSVLCNLDSITLYALPSGLNSYVWSLNNNILIANSDSIVATANGTYTVQYSDSSGCSDIDSSQIIFSDISMSLPGDTSFCAGNSISLSPGGLFQNYSWSVNDSVISNTQSILVSVTGNYQLTVSNNEGCTVTDSTIITVHTLPVVETIDDTTLCLGQTVYLPTTGAIYYNWTPALYLTDPTASDPVSNPLDDISYIVSGTDNNGCTNRDTVNISVNDIPVAAFTYSTDFGCDGFLIRTDNNSINAISYYWNSSSGETSVIANPVLQFTPGGQTIQLIALNGSCSDTLTLNVADEKLPLPGIIPNIITPNNDQKNDCFEISNLSFYGNCYQLQIFNRWGSEVFSSDDVNSCWKGISDGGNDLPEGTYFYIIKIAGTEKHGTVIIAR